MWTRRGVIKAKNFTDVIYGWPLSRKRLEMDGRFEDIYYVHLLYFFQPKVVFKYLEEGTGYGRKREGKDKGDLRVKGALSLWGRSRQALQAD